MFSKDFLNVKFHKKCIFNIKNETHRCNLIYDCLVSIPVTGRAQGDQSESSSPWCPPWGPCLENPLRCTAVTWGGALNISKTCA